MSAVAEKTPRDLLKSQYVGPACLMGTPVIYWKSGKRGAGGMTIGFARINNFREDTPGVAHVVNRGMISIQIPHLGVQESVMHADDPRLGANADQRSSGCWEHTPYQNWLNSLNQKLATVLSNQESKKIPAAASAKKPGPEPKNPAPAGSSPAGKVEGEQAGATLDSLTL